MATQNSTNLKVTNSADGFDIAGGTTARKFTLSGADVAVVGSGTAVVTFPTVTSTLATLAGTETLTNKTLTSPVLTTPALGTPSALVLTSATGLPTAGLVDDAVTLAKMAAGTAGNLITYDVSGNPAAVATGTATHVLTSNGAGADPTFQAAGGGGAVITTGTYAGNSTLNRAIAHGQGAIPKEVRIYDVTTNYSAPCVILGTSPTKLISYVQGVYQPVTTMDTTNFYVGGTWQYANGASDITYNWIAYY